MNKKHLLSREFITITPVCRNCQKPVSVRMNIQLSDEFIEDLPNFVCHPCKLAIANDKNSLWLKGE